jgi:nicotinamidase-related amidase
MGTIELIVTREELSTDGRGCSFWQVSEAVEEYPVDKTALLIVDMWDRHWSRGATVRAGVLAERINRLACALREKGVLVIHAPSETAKFYEGQPCRERFFAESSPGSEGDEETALVREEPLPIDDTDGGSDTNEDASEVDRKVWTRQHEAIEIDAARDLVAGDDGARIRSCLRRRGVERILYAGVHTNMCILKTRSFSILPMLKRNFKTALFANYTDAMYNPARRPYVSHDEGLRLVCSYIRKFYCPTVDLKQH